MSAVYQSAVRRFNVKHLAYKRWTVDCGLTIKSSKNESTNSSKKADFRKITAKD